ncbi:MAG TPA: enoyl-CoA hydratase [Pseudomonas xinjiangensis]|uniref:Enoyl-CoA hydratase n=2 Tax=root TaxID=1 RepID=A0A7V1FTC3_9GAMM|nr:enoyl-CoA hydratase [Halopseudomonas xinjiangensis]HEC47875.1 enoyl-CoA hydratase [Halopseudomonas xinjiangensis]
MADDSLLLMEIRDSIAWVTFNRPGALNALNVELAGLFLAACKTISKSSTIRAVVLQGNGRAFMAGGDIGMMAATPERVISDLIEPMHEALALLAEIDAPVLASVKGAVAGAGVSMMLAADLTIASETTRINTAYSRIGASGDLGITWTLPRVVGLGRAMDLMLRPRTLDATEALALGMVGSVVSEKDLQKSTVDVATQLAAGPVKAFGHIRRLLRQGMTQSFNRQLVMEAAAFNECLASEEMITALNAFLEKKPRQVHDADG